MNWIYSCIAGTISGILGSMGLGGGGALIIYLTMFTNIEQAKAQGINLLFFIPSAIIAVILYSRKNLISWKAALPAASLGLIGAFIGTRLSSLINNNILGKIFGVLLLVIGTMQLFSKEENHFD